MWGKFKLMLHRRYRISESLLIEISCTICVLVVMLISIIEAILLEFEYTKNFVYAYSEVIMHTSIILVIMLLFFFFEWLAVRKCKNINILSKLKDIQYIWFSMLVLNYFIDNKVKLINIIYMLCATIFIIVRFYKGNYKWRIIKLFYKKTKWVHYRFKYIISIAIFNLAFYGLKELDLFGKNLSKPIFSDKIMAVILCILTLSVIAILLISILPMQSESNIKVTASNFTLNDMQDHDVYVTEHYTLDSHFKIIKLDIKNAIKADEKLEFCKIVNYKNISTNKNNKKDSIYICIPLKSITNLNIVMELSYLQNHKKLYKKIRFTIILDVIYNNVYPSIFHCYDLIERSFISGYDDREYRILGCKDSNLKDFRYAFSSMLMFDQMPLEVFEKKHIDTRYFIYHDGDFGQGKSTYDLNLININGYKSIIISPWEENYDFDILYLIFTKVKEATHTYFHKLKLNVLFFYFLILVSLETFFLSNYNLLHQLFYPLKKVIYLMFKSELLAELLTYSRVIFIIYIPFMSLFLYKFLIGNLIIYKKDYSRIYQNFFIDEIIRMMKKRSKFILLIEDCDRLEPKASNSLFRTISSINSHMNDYHTYLGLLSFSKVKMDKLEGCEFVDLENKILYDKLNIDKHTYNSDLKLYIKMILEYISVNKGISLDELFNIYECAIDEKMINFRDIHKYINEIVKRYDHLDEESMIQILYRTFTDKKKALIQRI